MSGLIFTLLLGAISSGVLGSLFTRELGLDRMPIGDAWRGYVEESGYRVRVIARRRGERVEFILPDESIPEEICKRVVKRLSSEIYAKLLRREVPVERIKIVGPTPVFCRYCLEPIVDVPFRCRRCGEIFCANHRLPEQHGCPGKGKLEVGIAKGEREKGKKKERKKKEKIVVTQAACG